MLYVPNYKTGQCAYVRDKDTIRVYNQKPINNSTRDYTDYFVNSHYLYTSGTQTFTNTSTLPTCLIDSEVTNNVFYRNDISDSLVIFVIILIISFYFPYKIISRLFGRWFKI